MPDIPEKYKTLREITEAIARADDEIIENHTCFDAEGKDMEEPQIAREEFADAKSLVAERTEKATADFLREAAHHDVKHAIHKAGASTRRSAVPGGVQAKAFSSSIWTRRETRRRPRATPNDRSIRWKRARGGPPWSSRIG